MQKTEEGKERTKTILFVFKYNFLEFNKNFTMNNPHDRYLNNGTYADSCGL